jgi:hypothetical protein
LAVAIDLGVPAFKLAAPGGQLLRPDRLVLYCRSRSEADELVDHLRGALLGTRALGVPFTEPADKDGLLARATDPVAIDTDRPTSWRMNVVRHLSAAITDASAAWTDSAVLRYVGWRLRLEGIDPTRWTTRT